MRPSTGSPTAADSEPSQVEILEVLREAKVLAHRYFDLTGNRHCAMGSSPRSPPTEDTDAWPETSADRRPDDSSRKGRPMNKCFIALCFLLASTFTLAGDWEVFGDWKVVQ